jgi:glycine/D-amino acid oxidase-like deaminating enzyme
MNANQSPWLHALRRTRTPRELKGDITTDILIIGGGISGVTTAAFLLLQTNQKITLVEAGKVAHGATGRNAGQIVSYFERPFADIVNEYGLTLAAKAQDGIIGAWDLLFSLYKTFGLRTPLSTFSGYAGIAILEEAFHYLKDIALQHEAGLSIEHMFVAEDMMSHIPEEYHHVCVPASRSYIADILETDRGIYLAALVSRKGCLNSAMFSEELVSMLLERYPDRFSVLEQSPIEHVSLGKDQADSFAHSGVIRSKKVVLCTNGFEHIRLTNTIGTEIDHAFHEMVIGRIGYMAGYLEPLGRAPTGISYLPEVPAFYEEGRAVDAAPYFYMTRRPHEIEKEETHTLVCVGGPESSVPVTTGYQQDVHAYPNEALHNIDAFVQSTLRHAPPSPRQYEYMWHGLMGYTNKGLRCIGPEPENPVLLYNLGCNGIGILPSLYGGKRIADYVKFGILDESIFDPAFFRTSNVKKSNPPS